MHSNIIESHATGEEIEHLIANKLLPAVINEERHKVVIALLTFAITLLKPTVTAEEVQSGVKGCSQWLCLHLSESELNEALLPDHEKRILN